MDHRSVRELTSEEAHYIVDYFRNGREDFLRNMGVDPDRLRPRDEWISMIQDDLGSPLEEREYYYLLWTRGATPVGHSNLNHIEFGKEANMHLHMWYPERRKKGDGTYFVQHCIARYFEKFNLKKVICEPNVNNPAPNRLLERLGFTFIKHHDKNPGEINYFQTLSRWEMDRETFEKKLAAKKD